MNTAGRVMTRVTAAMTALALSVAPLRAQTAASKSYTLAFDSVNVFLMALVPPKDRGNVRDIKLSAAGQELRVDAEVRLSAVPGFELFGALGFAHVTGIGPMSVLQPGLVGWEIRTIQIAGQSIAQSLWAPLVRTATKRNDTYIPFTVGTWVKGVAVDPDGLRLF